jgi:hypothetical protein
MPLRGMGSGGYVGHTCDSYGTKNIVPGLLKTKPMRNSTVRYGLFFHFLYARDLLSANIVLENA